MNEVKNLREEIGSLYDEMKGISTEAKENGWTEESREKHENLYAEIQQKQLDAQVLERESEVEGIQNGTKKAIEGAIDQPAVGESPSKNAKANEEDLLRLTGSIFSTLASKKTPDAKIKAIGDVQKELATNGHYGEQYRNLDAFSTLTDKDGGIFLPESINDKIFDIADQNGVFSQHGMKLPLGPGDGRVKLPNLLGQLTFYAVNEGAEARASKLTFSAVTLEGNKYMTYVPWTSEMGEVAGARLARILITKLGEALARMRDEAVVLADGTSDYHNRKGFVTRSASSSYPEVRLSTAASGNATFATVDPDDFLNATLDVAKGIREKGRFALDPDWKVYLRQMKDANSIPYFSNGSGVISIINGQFFIYGYPVDFTEAIPSTDGASKTYGVFYVPEYYAFGDNGGFSMEEFNTGQIPDEDGTSNAINLLSQDMKAARVKTFFDFTFSSLTKTYDGTAYGFATVLRTAAS